MSRLSALRTHAAVVVVLSVLVSLFLGPRIYVDQVLLVGDVLFYTDPTFRVAGGDAYRRGSHNSLTHIDHTYGFYPLQHHVQGALSEGELPWWNPYVAMGIPAAGISAAVFEPLALVLGRLMSVEMLTNVRAVLSLIIGGWGVFVLATALGTTRGAALFAAVAWTFSGWSVAWLGRTNAMAEIWMPWLLWAIDRLLSRPTPLALGAVALFSGFACLTSHPQTSVQILAVAAVYAAARVLSAEDRATPARRLPIVAGALLLGITMALVQLVPMAELIRYADVPATGRGRVREADNLLVALWYGLIGDWTVISRDLPTAVTLVSPDFLGSPVNGTYWWKGYTLLEMMVYSGVLPLFFAGYAAVRRRETAGVGIWLLLTAVGFGAAYALPVFNLVNYVPILGLANNGRLRFVFRFALIMAAAFGLDRLMRDVAARRLRPWPWLGGFAALVLAVPILVWAALVWTARAPPPPSAMLGRQAGVVLVAAALLALGVLATRGILGRRAFVAAVVALAFVDALWHLGSFNGAIPRRDVFPQTPVVRFLKSDASLFRVSSGPAFMAANVKLPYRLFDVDLFDVLNLRRYASLQQVVNGQVFGADNTAHFFIFRRPQEYRGLMNLMNIKYVFMPPRGAVAGDAYATVPWYRPVYDREILIYENLTLLPRAFLVDRAEVVTADAALAAITHRDFNPRAAVLLEERSAPALTGGGGGATIGTAEVKRLTSNTVVVDVMAAGPAYLVLSEMNYPGWHARLDGRDVPVYQANYLFRAVHVPAGAHTVAFSFMPASYRLAVGGSLMALAVVVGCLVWGAVARGRRSAGRFAAHDPAQRAGTERHADDARHS